MSDKRREENEAHPSIRQQVFERDGHKCRIAPFLPDDRCFGKLTVHHVRKASAGGGYTVENLVTACVHHNEWVEDHPIEAEGLGLVKRWRPGQ